MIHGAAPVQSLDQRLARSIGWDLDGGPLHKKLISRRLPSGSICYCWEASIVDNMPLIESTQSPA